MCSLNPPLPQNTFAGPGGEGVDISGGHYSAGHKETDFPGGARTAHTQLGLGEGRRRFSLYSVLATSQWGCVCVICTISVRLGGLSEKSCPPGWKCPLKQLYASFGWFSGQPETRGCDNPMIGPSQGCSHRHWTHLPEPTFSPACLSSGLQGHRGQRAILDGLHSHAHSHTVTRPNCARPSPTCARPHLTSHCVVPWLGTGGGVFCLGTGTVTSVEWQHYYRQTGGIQKKCRQKTEE